ncbi:hypothetical protein LOTGIDRAFT_233867 [Lottia gigantea]|uniref:C3H1-type domain-containing protein n=1 Tax=Lottia gigantea TaxID=225164 RepID=V3ZGQ4_LOTGI|nr:hypothetical protein LOTGIDRAFT_233867 [Lottia gigantea]ESO90393.1 hypothetical protein LOTGIDRAFT_233867 [Lottia gigantea]
MKHPEYRMSLEAALPSTDSVHAWLGHQLEVRGIDSIVYTRYIISLLQQDYCEQFDCDELWDGIKYDHTKRRERKGDKKKSPVNEDERRKMAVLDCLQSVSDQDCDLENLVDELWKRLKEPRISKECCSPLSVNIQPEDNKTKQHLDVTRSQDPAQRYYAAFPALSGEDSPSSISPSACEVTVWKKNPLKTPPVGATAEKQDNKTDNEKPKKSTGRSEIKISLERSSHQSKKRSKSMTDTKESDHKTQKMESKKKSYPKSNKQKQQTKMQKVIKKHGGTVRFLSWPLTSQKIFEEENDGKDDKQKEAEAEYCNKVEQIIKTLLLSGVSGDQTKKSSGIDWPEWMREESLSPELQENFEWYTQPMGEILVTHSSSKRLYKRHSYPPSLLLDDDTDLEAILGPILTSMTSRYTFVDEVFSPLAEDTSKEDDFFENQVPDKTQVPKNNPLPQSTCKEEQTESESRLKVNPFMNVLDYSSPTNGLFMLFDNLENTNENACTAEDLPPETNVIGSNREVAKVSETTEACKENFKDEEMEKNLDLGKKRFESLLNLSNKDRLNPLDGEFLDEDREVSSAWNPGPDFEGGVESNSYTDLYEISSCSTSFDSDDGTDMSDFEGMFTFDMESEDDSHLKEVPSKQNVPKLTNKLEDLHFENVKESTPESPYGLDVPESTFFTEELMKSFNSVIDSPRSSGVCSVLVESPRNSGVCSLLVESPRSSVNADEQENWQSKFLLQEFLHSFEDDFKLSSDPWNSVLEESGLRWNLTPKNEAESVKEKGKSGQLYQLWNVNTQKKIPWAGLMWNMPCNFDVWSVQDESKEEQDQLDAGWKPVRDIAEVEFEGGEIYLSQTDDAVIGMELLEELHNETPKENTRNNLSVNSWERHERSVSDSDIHGLWGKYGSHKPEFHRSFELIPSETSAFTDVVPVKMMHVRSVPNMKLSSLMSLQSNDNPHQGGATGQQESSEHLYFSNETHFRPIQTPIGTPHEEKVEQRRDLFGDVGFSTGTPYQQFHQPGSVEEKLPMFRPKFKVQKDLDKYIQTGRSLEEGYNDKKQSGIETEKTKVAGNTGDIFDTTCDVDDPLGKESGFESNGEVEDSNLCQKEEFGDDLGYDWMEDSGLEAKFHHLYLDDTEQYLPAALSSLWKDKMSKIDKEHVDYSTAWSSGYDFDETRPEYNYDYLQYLPLVKDGELSFGQNLKSPSNYSDQTQSYRKSSAGHIDNLQSEFANVDINQDENEEFETPKGNEGFMWPGEEINKTLDVTPPQECEMKENNLSAKTMKTLKPYDFCYNDESEYMARSIPNSVDELSQYYLAKFKDASENVDHQPSTHELLHTHGYSVDIGPPVPIPDSAVYSYDLEQEDLGGGPAPGLPQVAVYSSDLEKQWLDGGEGVGLYHNEWPPYLNVPDARKKVNKTKKGTSRKPCSFFLEGACKRSDCKFSHDLSSITCRFWEDGMCFKGPLCPFLHGYHIISDSDSIDSGEGKFELKKEEFPELKTNKTTSRKESTDDKQKKTERSKEKKKKIVSTKVHKVN